MLTFSPKECDCDCHNPRPGMTMIHFAPCCNGQCPHCKKYFVFLREHIAECGANNSKECGDGEVG